MPINKPEKGKKRVCENCSCRWYDFNKNPIICPVCKQEFIVNEFIQSQAYKPFKDKKDTDKGGDEFQIEESNSETDNINDEVVSLEEISEEEIKD